MEVMKKCLLYFMLFSIWSCGKDDESIRRSQFLQPFHSIVLNDSFEVYLIEGSEYKVEVEGAASFIDKMKYTITDSVLTISNERKLKWNDPKDNRLLLWITSPALKLLTANETCDIKTINPITTHEFGIVLGSKANVADIEVNNQVTFYWNVFPCGGKVTFRGRSKELKLWNTAIMSVDATALTAEYALVDNKSKEDCSVHVSGLLEYEINGEGDVVVFGQPSALIDRGSSNSGRLILK